MNYSTQIVLLIICAQCVAVNIQKIEVPPLVEIGTESVILDCQYNTNTVPPSGLVMKWFFNGSSGLVYQWIPPLRPQVIGLLKGKVDMNFKISDEPLQEYRAIRILKPTTDLSGNYTCVVSTFIEEDRQTRPMLVYITLICVTEDVYPKPVMVMSARGIPLKQAVAEMRMDSWGLYTVTMKTVIHDDDVTTPFEEYVCTLTIPSANYSVNRTTRYYPGLMPTTYIATYEIQKAQEQHANGIVGLSRNVLLQLVFVLLVSIRLCF